MYSYLDYDNDRHRVRSRFMKEINKKTTLKDIGDLLDQLIINDKAADAELYDPEFHMNDLPKSATKDVTNYDLSWSGKILNSLDLLQPSKYNYLSLIGYSFVGECV